MVKLMLIYARSQLSPLYLLIAIPTPLSLSVDEEDIHYCNLLAACENLHLAA